MHICLTCRSRNSKLSQILLKCSRWRELSKIDSDMGRLSIRIVDNYITRQEHIVWEVLPVRCELVIRRLTPASILRQNRLGDDLAECPVWAYIWWTDHESAICKVSVLDWHITSRSAAACVSKRICHKYIAVDSCLAQIFIDNPLHPFIKIPAYRICLEASSPTVKFILHITHYYLREFTAASICIAEIIHLLVVDLGVLKTLRLVV